MSITSVYVFFHYHKIGVNKETLIISDEIFFNSFERKILIPKLSNGGEKKLLLLFSDYVDDNKLFFFSYPLWVEIIFCVSTHTYTHTRRELNASSERKGKKLFFFLASTLLYFYYNFSSHRNFITHTPCVCFFLLFSFLYFVFHPYFRKLFYSQKNNNNNISSIIVWILFEAFVEIEKKFLTSIKNAQFMNHWRLW